jgi:hypothetical protein
MAYVFVPFPKCKYHPDGRVAVVADAGEEVALGPAWADTICSPDVPTPYVPVAAAVSPDEAPPPEADPALPAPKRRGRPPKVQS